MHLSNLRRSLRHASFPLALASLLGACCQPTDLLPPPDPHPLTPEERLLASPLTLTQTIEQVRRRLADEDIQLVWGKQPDIEPGGLSCQVLASIKADERDETRQTMLFLHHAIDVYPPGMLARLGLTRLVLCRELWLSSEQHTTTEAAGGTTAGSSIYLSPPQKSGITIGFAFHHELGHFLESRRRDSDSRTRRGPPIDFWQWLATRGVNVTPQPETCRRTDLSLHDPSPEIAGYVSRYATCDCDEDAAETFAVLVGYPARLSTVFANDPGVQAKARLLRERLERDHDDFRAAFWSRAAEHSLEPDAPGVAPSASASTSSLAPSTPSAAPSSSARRQPRAASSSR